MAGNLAWLYQPAKRVNTVQRYKYTNIVDREKIVPVQSEGHVEMLADSVQLQL